MRRRPPTASPALVLFACLFTSQAGLLVLSPILVDVAREFGVSTATAGQLRTVSGAAGGLTALLLALAPRRPGLRTLLSAGAGLVSAASAASAAAPSFGALAIAQAALGVGIGVLVAAGIAAAGEWPSEERRATTLAWTIAGMPTAWVAGMPVVGAVADAGWRAAWLAVPAVAGLVALLLVRLRPADPPSPRRGTATSRSPEVVRFTAGELLANAAWAGVLTYSGALLLESYGTSPGTAALFLGVMATAMLPGTFSARRRVHTATLGLLCGLTALQGVAVLVLGMVRPHVAVTVGLLGLMAFTNGWRSMVASAYGMDSAPGDRLTVMAMRASANQFGYLLGGAAGGLALALGGFEAVGFAFAALFALAIVVHVPRLLPHPTPVPQEVS